ncbi:hypothetical protein H0H92_007607 [Tricholoma furcatifolium]|nr:hypothetical protein H0H92_007607 [Tricholoma furcatifolium]
MPPRQEGISPANIIDNPRKRRPAAALIDKENVAQPALRTQMCDIDQGTILPSPNVSEPLDDSTDQSRSSKRAIKISDGESDDERKILKAFVPKKRKVVKGYRHNGSSAETAEEELGVIEGFS